MKHGFDNDDDDAASRDPAEASRARLALTRMLIWAEREARLLDRPGSAEAIREAIEALFDDAPRR